MKVLVTGGAGFIGRHTVELLVAQGDQVVVVDRAAAVRNLGRDKSVTVYQLDIVSEELEHVFALERPDSVIHLAAQISVQRSLQKPLDDAETNIMGTIRLLQLCARYEVRKIIYASSAAVYGNPREVPVKETHATEPLSCYGVSKLVAEMYIQSFAGRYNLDYSILRYANVYGIREIRNGEDGVLTAFVERMIAGLPLEVYGDGSQTRDFIYLKDVAAANAAALRTGSRQVMNISSGTGISLLEAVDVLRELSGRNVSPQHRPPQSGDIEHSVLDNGKARDVLWWQPAYSFYAGLREMVEFEAEARKNPLLVQRVGTAAEDGAEYTETSVG